MKKRMIIVTALIMGTLGAGCVSVQASDTLPELTKDNALEQICLLYTSAVFTLAWMAFSSRLENTRHRLISSMERSAGRETTA